MTRGAPLHRSAKLWPLFAAAGLYVCFWPFVTPDVTGSYVPWLSHIEASGPVRAFAAPFGDYAPPYLYALALLSPLGVLVSSVTLVKLVAVGATGLLTVTMHRLLRALGVADPWRLALLTPLLPGVALNASLLASADALWAAPCVWALACAAERRHVAMLAWCGAAVAVKQQAMFIAPFVLGLVIARRVPLRQWLAAPAAFAAMYLPAWAAGWPARDLLTIYLRQQGACPQLSLDAPNLWSIVQDLPGVGALPLAGLAMAGAIGAAAWFAADLTTRKLESRSFAAAALLSPLLVAGLLPHMHERYFFLADVLALVWAGVAGTRRAVGDAVLVQAGSGLAVMAYISGVEPLATLGAVATIAATWRVASALWRRGANDNAPLAPSQAYLMRQPSLQGSCPQFISE